MEGDEDPWPGSVEGSVSIVVGVVEGIMNIGKGGRARRAGRGGRGVWDFGGISTFLGGRQSPSPAKTWTRTILTKTSAHISGLDCM